MSKSKPRRAEPKLSESAELKAALETGDKGGVTRIVSQSALAEITFVNLLAFGNSHFVSPEYIADLLISRAEARGVSAAVAEVERAFCEGVVPAFHVMAVSGLSCSGAFSLGDITIQPFEALEPGWRSAYAPEYPGMTAIVRPTLTPVYVDGNATWGNEDWWIWYNDIVNATDDILNRLCVAAGGSAFCRAMWHVRDPRDPWVAHPHVTLVGQVHPAGNCGADLTNEALDLAKTFRDDRLKESRLALNRYRRAGGTSIFQDAAIEIAIAFESLLLQGENDGELSLKLRLRAAHLLGSSPDERRHVHDIVKRMYDTRSKVVHQGGVLIPEIQLRDQTYEALALFPRAAKLLLTRDRLKPDDWTRLLLGGSIDP